MRVLGVAILVVLHGTSALLAQHQYDNPIVFQRTEFDERTGQVLLRAKLWVMEADGSGLRQLTQGTTYDDHPSFYADREHVLYAEFPTNDLATDAGAKLIKLNIYTGHREVVAAIDGCALHHATLSPIDDLLAYHRDCGQRRSQWVGLGPDAYEVTLRATNGVRTRDGIVAMHEKNSNHRPREVALVYIRGHGAESTVRLLTDDTALHRRPAVSGDGEWIAWQTNVEGQGDEIFLANIHGTARQNVTKAPGNDGHPWFARDGEWIVLESDRSGTWEIWRVELQTGKQEQLTFGGKQYASTRPRM